MRWSVGGIKKLLILRSLRSRRLEGRTPAERGIEPGAQGLQRLLPLLPDHIDLGVVGDRLQRDVRDALVHKTLADVARVGVSFGGVWLTSPSLRCPSGLSASW